MRGILSPIVWTLIAITSVKYMSSSPCGATMTAKAALSPPHGATVRRQRQKTLSPPQTERSRPPREGLHGDIEVERTRPELEWVRLGFAWRFSSVSTEETPRGDQNAGNARTAVCVSLGPVTVT